MKIKVKIGDNENRNYSEIVYAVVSDNLWNKYKNLDIEDDDYWTVKDECWDRLCDAVEHQNTLPLEWYVEKDFEEA